MLISIMQSIICAIIYGFMENRLFRELKFDKQAEEWFFDHFKTYHIFMGGLFATIAFSFNTRIWVMNMILMPFIQDSSWFIFERRKPKREDWSNWLPFYKGKPPLFHGLFIWYWLSMIVIAILGISIMIFP